VASSWCGDRNGGESEDEACGVPQAGVAGDGEQQDGGDRGGCGAGGVAAGPSVSTTGIQAGRPFLEQARGGGIDVRGSEEDDASGNGGAQAQALVAASRQRHR
jgi:hypothetical protein